MPLTLETILALLHYDSTTGILRWKAKRGRGQGRGKVNPGDIAGTINAQGYVAINIAGHVTLAHRLAWAIAHQLWPVPFQLDHINMNRTDNRISNLRPATNAQNMRNRKAQKNSSTGVKGVYVHKRSGKFIASIACDGRTMYLGLFSTVREAKAAYDAAAERLHGPFARS